MKTRALKSSEVRLRSIGGSSDSLCSLCLACGISAEGKRKAKEESNFFIFTVDSNARERTEWVASKDIQDANSTYRTW